MSLPPHTNTESRSVSYDYNDVIGHVYRKEKLASSVKIEFDTYKKYLRGLDRMIKTNTHVSLSESFYDRQEQSKQRMTSLLEKLKLYDKTLAKHYQTVFTEFEEAYRGYILYLYTSDKLTIEESLLKREDVRSFFGIRKKLVSFSKKTTVFILPSNEEPTS